MIQVSYVSRTSEPLSAEQLLKLLMQCRENNKKWNVTGLLLYGNGTFLQVIEGEEAVVDELVEVIRTDPRHADVQMLSRRPIEERQYSDWTMGFDRVTDEGLQQIDGLREFGATDFNFDYLVKHEPVVEKLVEHYRAKHWDPLIREIDARDRVIEHLRQALVLARDRAEVAVLVLESMLEASRKGEVSEALLRMCESALASLRPH